MKLVPALAAGILVAAITYAQDAQPANGWPRQEAQPPAQQQQPPYSQPNSGSQPTYGAPDREDPAYNRPASQANPYGPPPSTVPIPSELTIVPGTYMVVRVNQEISSDRNQRGDAFSATLVQPIVVNGVVVAEPGQTLGGVVAEAERAGRVKGVARLGVQLTDLTLVDGQRLPIQTQLISRSGDTSNGRDAGAIAATTGGGALIGAAAGEGSGAAIGAGAGAAAGIIGVLLTRGHDSVVYPEQLLTFRIEAPVHFSTANSVAAFHYVQPGEYNRNAVAHTPPSLVRRNPVYVDPYPSVWGYPYGYPYGSPYYWGPSFGVVYYGGHYGHYGRYGRWR